MATALSTNRSKQSARFCCALAVYVIVSGCGEEMPSSAPLVVTTSPGRGDSWAADRVLRIVFDRYLDASSINPAAVRLHSGEVNVSVAVGYDPVDRALVVEPRVPLRPGLGYTLTVEAGAVAALGGDALAEPVEVDLRAGPAVGVVAPEPVVFARDVAPVFAGRCGCHGPAPAVFPALAPESLVGVASARRPDEWLVVPGAPLESELVRRILPDHPGTRGMEKVLTDEERRLIVRWVAELG